MRPAAARAAPGDAVRFQAADSPTGRTNGPLAVLP